MSSDSQQDNGPVQYSDDDDYGSDANPDRSSVVSTGVRASKQYRESRNIHGKQGRQSLGNLIANKLQQEPRQELFGKVPDDITQIIQKEAQQIQQNLPTEVSNNQTPSNTEEISNRLGNENNGQVAEKTENQVHDVNELLSSQPKEEGAEVRNQTQQQQLHKQNVLLDQIEGQQMNRNEIQNQQVSQNHQEKLVGNVEKNESEQNREEEHKQHQKTGEAEVELKNQQQVRQENKDEHKHEQQYKQDQKLVNQNIEQQTSQHQHDQEHIQIISQQNKPFIEKVEEPSNEEQNKLPVQTDTGVDHEPRQQRQEQQYFGEAKQSRHSLTDEFTKLQELKQIQVQEEEQDQRERIQEVIKHQMEDEREQLIGTEIEQVGQFDDQVQLEVVGTRAPLHEGQFQTDQFEQNLDNHEQIIEQSGNHQNKEHEVEESHQVQLTPNYNIAEQNAQKIEEVNEHEPVPIVLQEKPNNQQVKIGQQIKTQDAVVDEGVSAQVQPDPIPEPQPDPQIQTQQPVQSNQKQIEVDNRNDVQQIRQSEAQIKNQDQAMKTGLQSQQNEQQNKSKQQQRQEVVQSVDTYQMQKDRAEINEQIQQQQNEQKHEQKENQHEQGEHKHNEKEKQEEMEQKQKQEREKEKEKEDQHTNRQQQIDAHNQNENENNNAQQQIQGEHGLINASENVGGTHQQHENQVEQPQIDVPNSKYQTIENQEPTQQQQNQHNLQKTQQKNVQSQQEDQKVEHEQQDVEVSSPLPVNKWTKAQSQHLIQPTQSDLIVPKPTTTYEHEHRSPQQSRVQDEHFTTEQLKQNPQIYELQQRNVHNTEHEVQHATIDSKQFIPDAQQKVNNFTLGEVNSLNVGQGHEVLKDQGEIIQNVQKVQDNEPHKESDSKNVQSSSPLKQQSMINVSSLSNIAIERRHHDENIKKFIDSDPIHESDLLTDSAANKNNTGTTANNLSEADSMKVQASQKINLIPTVEEVSKKQEDEEQIEQDKPVSKPTMAEPSSKKPKKESQLSEPPKLVLKQSDLGVERKQQQIMDSEYEINRKVLATSSVKPKPKTEQKAQKPKACECQVM